MSYHFLSSGVGGQLLFYHICHQNQISQSKKSVSRDFIICRGQGLVGSDRAASGAQPADAGGQENASCPDWPHIDPRKLKKYQNKNDEKRLREYIFLHCCEHQCIECCRRCLREYDVDPKSCESTRMDGLGWALYRSPNGVSLDFGHFSEGLTS